MSLEQVTLEQEQTMNNNNNKKSNIFTALETIPLSADIADKD
jgi:hypothetical protein